MSQDRYRDIVAVAVTMAFIGLGVYFLSGSHSAASYTNTGAENRTTASTCTRPKAVPMNPGNAQSGVTRGNYYVTSDSWKSITSRFSDVPPGSGPAYGTWEFEYDIWLNGLADSNSTGIMIWTYSNGQAPTGSPVGSFTDAGQDYVVYRSQPPDKYIAFVALNGSLSGHVNLLDFFRYAIGKGWMPASSKLYQVCHGVELVSTNGKREKFAVDNFAISMTPRS